VGLFSFGFVFNVNQSGLFKLGRHLSKDGTNVIAGVLQQKLIDPNRSRILGITSIIPGL
jgi:hypothetical protein